MKMLNPGPSLLAEVVYGEDGRLWRVKRLWHRLRIDSGPGGCGCA